MSRIARKMYETLSVERAPPRTVACSGASLVAISLSPPSPVWDKARKTALSAEEYASVLGKRPYDLRHARVPTWLAAGVPSTQVAEWTGHSVAVLHRIYAKVLAGQEASARQCIERALGVDDVDRE